MTQMWQEIMEQPEVTARCFQENEETIRKIVQLIRQRDIHAVVIAARGTSDHAAVYGKYVIESLTGCKVCLSAPSIFTMYRKTVDMSDSVVIGISQSGQAEDVAAVLSAANDQKAITIAVTNYKDSPLAKLAQHHLFCAAGVEKSVAATKTFTAEMMLMAMLAAEWAGDAEMTQKLRLVPQKIAETLKTADDIRSIAQRYRFMNECFVLARGINYSIALEMSLKIQETNYIRAKAFANSDFQHGPIAMLQKDMPVFIFAPSGASESDAEDLIDKINDAQADLLVISDDPSARAKGSCSLSIPSGNDDYTSPFCNVAVAQMFACSLAVARGLNPDQPRMLHKVTRTV